MSDKEIKLLSRFAEKYSVDCKPSEDVMSFWDFTYEFNLKKYYCEMKQRSFSIADAYKKYPEGLILEMHKYERILRKTKNEELAEGLYFNFFSDGTALVFNLNTLPIDSWIWRKMPQSTEFSKKKYVYKYIALIDYRYGNLFYL